MIFILASKFKLINLNLDCSIPSKKEKCMFSTSPLIFLQQFCAEQLTLYTIQNYFEIFVFTVIIYKCLRWLQTDYTKPMVLYIYLYSGTLISSHMMNAPILFWTLLICSPIVAILSIITHQTHLQKYIAHASTKTFYAQALPDPLWIEMLLRSVLFAAHHKKNIFCIMMRHDNIQHFLEAPYTLNVPIQKDILDLILASTMIENPSIMLIDHHGNLKYINATWSDRMHKHMIITMHHSSVQHSESASSIIANLSDAIIFNINPISKHATVWHHDTVVHDISIDQLLSICKKIIFTAKKPISEHVNVPSWNAPKQKEL